MKTSNWSYFLLIILPSVAFGLTGQEILDKMDQVQDYKTAQMEATMRIEKKGQEPTTMKLISYEKTKGDKGLMRFTYPGRLKGTAILTVDDNIWYYNKRTNRVRLLSKSAKKGSMMGSSFSYDDLSLDYKKNFTAEVLDDKPKHYMLKVIPNDQDKKYKHMICKVLKDNFVATSVDYFNHNNIKYKELKAENIKVIKGHAVPLKMSMKEVGSAKITFFEIDESTIQYDLDFKDSLFSERKLKK